MTKKEHTTITELFQVLDLLESLDMQFWLDGGWEWMSCTDSKPACIEILTLILMPIIQTNSLIFCRREDIKLKQIGCPPVWNCIAKN